jgi:LysM repeat protein
MKLILLFAFSSVLICLSGVSFAGAYLPQDSIGMERKGNKVLILHRVEAGETLSSIARQYRTTLSEMRTENPDAEAGLQPGQVVKVPYVAPQAVTANGSTPRPATQAQTTGIHTVADGESLFGIARMYRITVSDLQKWNGLSGNSIKVGDELAVSARAAQAKASMKPAEAQPGTLSDTSTQSALGGAAGRKTHTVAPGQTLNAVSRMYKVSLNDLRQWNNLTSDNLTVGQELVIQGSATAATYSNTEDAATEEMAAPKIAKEKEAEPEKIAVQKVEEPAPKIAQKEEPKPAPEASTGKSVPPAGGYQKAIEVGLAELIDGTQGNEKYLALHRTAPVGTIIQVKNLMNDLSVFVKVIGKLPDTGANDKLVVKISNKAYERLAAVDKKFRVEVSYIP